MCAPVSDGAACAVICAKDVLKKLEEPRAVKILGSQVITGVQRGATDFDKHVGHIAAKAVTMSLLWDQTIFLVPKFMMRPPSLKFSD